MENETAVELALEDGTEYRRVRLSLDSSGAIEIDVHDMGPAVKRVWDHDDYQFSVTVPSAAVSRLAFELLKEKFAGNLRAADALRSFCEEHEVPHNFSSWP